ncbi:predicted protein [Chaetoceros tenuissimus]|uniref:Uncharacterized protein n=1 Tax=Chaetoceros tenuissimus TaxID=426638 RepID=A0AAD3HAH8_9STRA|nr:predicted protein [Chaetoceros tenuissimus]
MPKSKNILSKLKNKLKKKKSSKPIHNEEQDNITQASTIDSPEQTLNKVIGPHIHYESSKISQIHSDSYLNDTRRLQSLADQTDDERSVRSEDSDEDSEALQQLYDTALESFTSPQMKLLQENDEHRQAIRDHKRKLKEGTAADKLLNKLLGRKMEDSLEEDYETFVVPKLSQGEKNKHRHFFRQLDGDDDTTVKSSVKEGAGQVVCSDNSVAASMKSNKEDEEEQSVHTHNSRSTRNSRTTNGEQSTAYDQSTTYTEHTNATSSTSFFKRMYCACNGSGQQIEDDTTTVKEVKIHPVARVYHIEHKDM